MKPTLALFLCVMAIPTCMCCAHTPSAKQLGAMTNADIAEICNGRDITSIKLKLGLNRYQEQDVPGGNIDDAMYRYNLGNRWLFVEFHSDTGAITRAFFADKK